MSTSVGAATDFIVATARAAVINVTVNGKPVEVSDGWQPDMAFGVFVVGVHEPPPNTAGETSGTRMWASLGAMRYEEDYTVPCYIDVRDGATQKTVRDAAIAIFDVFWSLLRNDLTLGGALGGGKFAEIVDFTLVPSRVGTAAEPGSRQLIRFSVHCRSLTS